MRSLLADRFRLAAHHEIRQLPVYALLLDQPGKLGPLLQKHPDGAPCPATPMPPSPPPLAPPQALDARFPPACGGFVDMAPSAPGRIRAGARAVSLESGASTERTFAFHAIGVSTHAGLGSRGGRQNGVRYGHGPAKHDRAFECTQFDFSARTGRRVHI